jgi:type IX secretion system PorP/SprF family membrane protein
MKIKKILIIILLVFPYNSIFGQQEASFSLYMFNHQLLNPAYVGAKEYTSITLGSRSQWSGFPGAPETSSLSVGHLLKNKNLGLGFSVIKDRVGPTDKIHLSVDLAYHLPLNEKGLKLGLGIKLNSRSLSLDTNMFIPVSINDPFFSDDLNDNFAPNIGFGLYLHSPKFYFGFGIPNFIEDEEIYLNRNYYFFTGALFNLNQSIKIKPSILVQKSKILPWIYDNSIIFSYKEIFWLGPQLRANIKEIAPNQTTAGFFGAIAGFNLSKHLSLGYAYQGTLANKNSGINNTSHEFLIRIHLFPKSIGDLRSPRLF